MIRNGKIGRLPPALREQLNQRLSEGQSNSTLVSSLHALPEVPANQLNSPRNHEPLLSAPQPQLQLHCNCTKIAVELHQNCTGIAAKPSNCTQLQQNHIGVGGATRNTRQISPAELQIGATASRSHPARLLCQSPLVSK